MNKTKIDNGELISLGSVDMTALEDVLLVMAKNMENALRSAGAKSGEDYKIKDLFEMATPFALEIFSKQEIHFVKE